MVLADVRLGQVIWTMLFLFMLAAFVWVFVLALRHLFHDRELSGWAKAGWLVGLIVFPLIGSLVYLVVRGGWVTEGRPRIRRRGRGSLGPRSSGAMQQRRRWTGTRPVDHLTRPVAPRSIGTNTDARVGSTEIMRPCARRQSDQRVSHSDE